MKIFGLVSLLVVTALVALWLGSRGSVSPETAQPAQPQAEQSAELDAAIANHIEEKNDLIRVEDPQPLDVIGQPLSIIGEARGYWFFEASFPVILTDWDGRIIAEHYATAQGDWMTDDFVRFEADIQYSSPYQVGDPDFMQRGTLILQRNNASGLPENDDALEFPIRFDVRAATTSTPVSGPAN